MNRSQTPSSHWPLIGAAAPAMRGFGKAGHPFRRSLPAHVLRELPKFEPEVLAAMRRAEERLSQIEVRSQPVDFKRIGMQDVRDFLIAYCACFLAVAVFIA